VIGIAVRKTIQNVARSFECACIGDGFASALIALPRLNNGRTSLHQSPPHNLRTRITPPPNSFPKFLTSA
jgi:hypothetical protein